VVADPVAPSVLRRDCRRWLERLGWPEEEIQDLVLAVNEAVANVVDHAYRAPVEAQLYCLVWLRASHTVHPNGQRRVIIEIRDSGRWKPAPADPGYRGRGLAVMRACVDVLDIDTGDTGTQVIFLSRPLTAADEAVHWAGKPLAGRRLTHHTPGIPTPRDPHQGSSRCGAPVRVREHRRAHRPDISGR
jgi:anti-sigma regulatory factor (Ser/Thr protein kinase)